MLDVGRGSVAGDSSYYNLIEDNVIFYGGHHCLAAWGKYCIFRNNYLHNERSDDSVYGYRCAISHGRDTERNLFEGNRIAFAYKASGMSLRSSNKSSQSMSSGSDLLFLLIFYSPGFQYFFFPNASSVK